jgi:hypothetical protein
MSFANPEITRIAVWRKRAFCTSLGVSWIVGE